MPKFGVYMSIVDRLPKREQEREKEKAEKAKAEAEKPKTLMGLSAAKAD